MSLMNGCVLRIFSQLYSWIRNRKFAFVRFLIDFTKTKINTHTSKYNLRITDATRRAGSQYLGNKNKSCKRKSINRQNDFWVYPVLFFLWEKYICIVRLQFLFYIFFGNQIKLNMTFKSLSSWWKRSMKRTRKSLNSFVR